MKLARVASSVPFRVPYIDAYKLVNDCVASDRIALEYSAECGGHLRIVIDGELAQCIAWTSVREWMPEAPKKMAPPVTAVVPPPPSTQASLPNAKKKR